LLAVLISSAGTGLFKAVTMVQAQGEIAFSKLFTPDTIGVGATSTLVFTIQNFDSLPVTGLAFTDNLPAGVSIAAPANATSTCVGTLTAPDGGGTISLSGGELGAGSTCIITVGVTSSAIGTHLNTSGILTWDGGENGSAIAYLNVVTDRPGFSKNFAPGAVSFGGKSTLTFDIDNSANNSAANYLAFVDNLPTGMVVADPANASTTCTGGTLTAVPGTSVISYSLGSVAEGSSCTVSVDVVAFAVGALGNVSGELTSSPNGTSGKASAVLDVTVGEIALVKSFADDPVAPGDTVTLEFTIHNLDRGNTATNIAFTDDLGATLAGLAAVGLPANDVCGTGSQLSGSSTLSLTGGNLAPDSSCTFGVTLQVPAAAFPGAHANTTSPITADGDLVGDPGTDTLYVSPAPILTKQFVNDPVAAGDTVTLTFTIRNTSQGSSAASIAFVDELTTFFPYPVSVGLPSAGFCGAGASMSLISVGFERQVLSMTGGSLGPGASCTFDVTLLVPAGMAGGSYTNTTGDVTAVVDDKTVTGSPATDDLVVISAPDLSKSFTNDPVAPGDTVTLEFRLSLSEEAPADATDIAFTDNLSDAMAGLTAIGLPASDVCGAGSLLAGTTDLSFAGGSLAPGESCAFSVTLQVPAIAASGHYTNQTSVVTADMLGLTGAGLPAVDVLAVSNVFFTKTFVGDPVIPGGTVTLRFTISNTHPLTDATDMHFTDDLDAVLSGLAPTGLPAFDVCGAGSLIQIIGSVLQFSGGFLPSGGACTFDVTLQVPAGTASDTYNNTTSNFSVVIGGGQVLLDPAVDTLDVFADWLLLTKAFTNDPVMPDGTVTLEFTITNTHATQTATNIGFTDNLSAALPGLAAIGLPANDVCGAGSDLSGTDLLTLSGGSLGPGASCTFSVALYVPKTAALGTYVNTTSQVTGEITGLAVRGDPGIDDLSVAELIYLPLVVRNY
jgi:hypothetical protein